MKKLILIAEDEANIRNDIVKILSLYDYETVAVDNGRKALEAALKHFPDLIISDIMMPELNGYELLDKLLGIPQTASIPFLFLTAKSDKNDVRLGMNLGADDFITKPFDFDDLINAVDSRIKKKELAKQHSQERFEALRSNIARSLPHEIRTPLNIILGFSDLMIRHLEEIQPEEFRDYLLNIHGSAKRLHKLFDKYLLFASLEIVSANSKELNKILKGITPSTKSLIQDIAHSVSETYSRNDDLFLEIEDITLQISQENLKVIVEELLDNAFKYSDEGNKVFLNCTSKKECYTMIFKDFGRGMSADQIEQIGAYMQFDRRVYEQQGQGLGLALVMKIIELHRGTFSVASEINTSTTITIELPYK